jgi:hypothetical protein
MSSVPPDPISSSPEVISSVSGDAISVVGEVVLLFSSAGPEQALAKRKKLAVRITGTKRREDARIMIPHHGRYR